ILLTLAADRRAKLKELRAAVERDYGPQVEKIQERDSKYYPFRWLDQALNAGDSDADCEAFGNFLRALQHYEKKSPDEGAPEAIVRTSTILDRVLKEAMDAYAADMAELFLDPLLARARYRPQ